MIDQSVKKERKYNSLLKLIGLTTTCGLSAFYFGYCITYFNAIPYKKIVEIYSIEPKRLTEGLITASINFTGAFGAMTSMYFANRLSCRQCLILLSALALVFSAILVIPNIWILVVARLAQGIVVGMISCITPWFISEMIPKSVAGPFWSYHQCLLIVGITASFVVSSYCSSRFPFEIYWRIVFCFPVLTSGVQLLSFLLIFRHESPKFLLSKDEEEKAMASLRFLYKEKYVEVVFKEILEAV